MEKEKLIIKNFGPIKSVELDLGRFNILIGEQATGKSTVAKVLAVCRYFSYIYWNNDFLGISNSPLIEGLEVWGLWEYINPNTYIYYKCNNYSVVFEYSNYKESAYRKCPPFTPDLMSLTQDFRNLLAEVNKVINKTDSGWSIPTSFFLNDVKNLMDNPFYLPTERGLQSIFSLGQASIPNLANFLFNYYSKVDGIFKSFKTETEIEPLSLFYVNRNGVGYIRKKNEQEFYLLANAASGYQSTIPVVLVMNYYNELRKKNKTFIIEEPELNLFPSAQNKLMQYIVDMSNKHDNNILFTTQSPYTLTSVNNMMFACQVGKIDSSKASDIVNEKYWISYENVSAYLLKADGTAENIMDDEVKQIKAEKIDEISRQFNKEYDEMLDIKYPGK